MHRLNELVARLTQAQLKEVEDFAEFLLARQTLTTEAARFGASPTKISYDGWAGCLADMNPELSDLQFNDLILDEWARAAED